MQLEFEKSEFCASAENIQKPTGISGHELLMSYYTVLPKHFEDILTLPNGDLWLYSNGELIRDTSRSPEYKVYSRDRDIWRKLKALDGATLCCSYTRTGEREPVAHDLVVQSFAARDALLILGWEG